MSAMTENPLTDEEFLKLWKKLVRYVAYTACKTYSLTFEDIEDIEQDINIRLLKLPDDRRVQEGYVRVVINNALRESLRKCMAKGDLPAHWKNSKTIDFETAAPGNDYDADGSALIDAILPVPESPEEYLTTKAFLEQAMDTLPPALRIAVSAYYLEDLSIAKVAERCGVSRPTIQNRIKAALRLLKAHLQSD
jgi:RNA polymerase sigma factor (sigma-70 family)